MLPEGAVRGTAAYRMVLPVRNRIQFGRGRFCLSFLPRMRLTLKDLCDGYEPPRGSPHKHSARRKGSSGAMFVTRDHS